MLTLSETARRQVGMRIRLSRERAGLTQAALGAALGVSHGQIRKYESGHTSISPARLLRLCETLKTPPSYFLEGVEDVREFAASGLEHRAAMALLSSAEGLELAAAWASIQSPPVRRAVLAFVQAIAEGPDGDRRTGKASRGLTSATLEAASARARAPRP
jgi:transcriptional regulator with XRE-family HTH domain